LGSSYGLGDGVRVGVGVGGRVAARVRARVRVRFRVGVTVCMQISGVGMSPHRLAPRSPRQRAMHNPGPSHGLPFSCRGAG